MSHFFARVIFCASPVRVICFHPRVIFFCASHLLCESCVSHLFPSTSHVFAQVIFCASHLFLSTSHFLCMSHLLCKSCASHLSPSTSHLLRESSVFVHKSFFCVSHLLYESYESSKLPIHKSVFVRVPSNFLALWSF
ncbi:hypothetical protein O6H91_Y009500 [Diphasiastrum complanatum]|nr:hypothetical protein O6H91_Y009500 [Diphasiastrum complanatum]